MALSKLSADEHGISARPPPRKWHLRSSQPSAHASADTALSLAALSLDEKVMFSTLAAADETLPAASMEALPNELLQHILSQLCNALEPRLAMYFSSVNSGLRVLLTPALRQQLRADHEVAAALCRKVGMRSCKELREATKLEWLNKGLAAADLATLSTLGSVLPALESLLLIESSGAAGPDGVQRLAEGLGAGALPAVTTLTIGCMHVGDAGASALAAALGRGALPRLKILNLNHTAIGDAGLVALAPALRRRPALEYLLLPFNLFGDEGLAALLAPPLPAGAPPTAVLPNLKVLHLSCIQVTDAGCAALAATLDSGALPALKELNLYGIPASAAAKAAVYEARANLQDPYGPNLQETEHEESGSEEEEEEEEGEDDSEGGEEDE